MEQRLGQAHGLIFAAFSARTEPFPKTQHLCFFSDCAHVPVLASITVSIPVLDAFPVPVPALNDTSVHHAASITLWHPCPSPSQGARNNPIELEGRWEGGQDRRDPVGSIGVAS